MTRKLKKGGYAALLSLIVTAAVILFNMIVGRLPESVRQWDMSDAKIYTLGDTTKEVLRDLNQDVTIYVVADPATVDERITSFLKRYEELSKRVKVEHVDSILHPERVKQLNALNNTLLVSSKATNKTETIPFSDIIKFDEMSYYYYGQINETEFDGEGLVTGAISHVSNEVQKTIYATEGHKESPLGEPVSDLLQKSNLTVSTINLLTNGSVPEDCELLIINGPQSDLADDEKTMVEEYLNKGGKLMVLSGYSERERPNLNAVFDAYGLRFENGLAADTKRFYQNNPYYIFPTMMPGNEVTEGTDSKGTALLLQSGALTQKEELPKGVAVTPFMETSDGGLLVAEDGSQTPGTYILGAVSQKTTDSATSRLTVITSPSLIDQGLNQTFTNLTNLDLFMNAVTANFEDVTNVSIPAKSLEVTYNTVTHGGIWGLVFIAVIPVGLLAVGLMVWQKRRRL